MNRTADENNQENRIDDLVNPGFCRTVLLWSQSSESHLDQKYNPKRGLEIKSRGTECYKLSPISTLFLGPSWSF